MKLDLTSTQQDLVDAIEAAGGSATVSATIKSFGSQTMLRTEVLIRGTWGKNGQYHDCGHDGCSEKHYVDSKHLSVMAEWRNGRFVGGSTDRRRANRLGYVTHAVRKYGEEAKAW